MLGHSRQRLVPEVTLTDANNVGVTVVPFNTGGVRRGLMTLNRGFDMITPTPDPRTAVCLGFLPFLVLFPHNVPLPELLGLHKFRRARQGIDAAKLTKGHGDDASPRTTRTLPAAQAGVRRRPCFSACVSHSLTTHFCQGSRRQNCQDAACCAR